MSAVIVAGTLSLWQKKQEAYFRGSEAAQAQQDGRVALQVMARDIRQAMTIVAAEAGRIVFESILDPIPAPQRTFDLGTVAGCIPLCVRYDRGDGSGARAIADNLVSNGLQFTYRDAGGNVLSAPVSAANLLLIQQVDITVRGQMTLANPDPPFAFSSTVKLRNR